MPVNIKDFKYAETLGRKLQSIYPRALRRGSMVAVHLYSAECELTVFEKGADPVLISKHISAASSSNPTLFDYNNLNRVKSLDVEPLWVYNMACQDLVDYYLVSPNGAVEIAKRICCHAPSDFSVNYPLEIAFTVELTFNPVTGRRRLHVVLIKGYGPWTWVAVDSRLDYCNS